jgi:hypothetical protein
MSRTPLFALSRLAQALLAKNRQARKNLIWTNTLAYLPKASVTLNISYNLKSMKNDLSVIDTEAK